MLDIILEPSGCWSYPSGLDGRGYHRVMMSGKRNALHRLVYEYFRGTIPKGLCIDHLCRNRGCCNPDHLEVVTKGENTRRGEAPTIVARREGRCLKGHELTEENLLILPDGERVCRLCARSRNKEYHLRKNNGVVRLPGGQTRTHCKWGHELSGDNVYVNPLGHKHCRACAKAREARRKGRGTQAGPRGGGA